MPQPGSGVRGCAVLEGSSSVGGGAGLRDVRYLGSSLPGEGPPTVKLWRSLPSSWAPMPEPACVSGCWTHTGAAGGSCRPGRFL